MNVNGKYLKDESGDIISPIVSTNSIYDSQNLSLNENRAFIRCYLPQDKLFNAGGSDLDFNGGNFESNNITKEGRIFSIKVDGLYYIELYVHFMASDSKQAGRVFTTIGIDNNTNFNGAIRSNDISTTSNDPSIRLITMQSLTIGSSIEAGCYMESDGKVFGGKQVSSTTNPRTYIYIKRIGSIDIDN